MRLWSVAPVNLRLQRRCFMSRAIRKCAFPAATDDGQDRHVVEEAYAGDIIGVFDPGIFSLGIRYVHREKIRV